MLLGNHVRLREPKNVWYDITDIPYWHILWFFDVLRRSSAWNSTLKIDQPVEPIHVLVKGQQQLVRHHFAIYLVRRCGQLMATRMKEFFHFRFYWRQPCYDRKDRLEIRYIESVWAPWILLFRWNAWYNQENHIRQIERQVVDTINLYWFWSKMVIFTLFRPFSSIVISFSLSHSLISLLSRFATFRSSS